MDQKLFDLAKKIMIEHLRCLRDRRNNEKLFKRVNDQGKVYGRSFKFKSQVYKSCIQQNISFIEIIEKKGDDKKYMYALNKIFFSCVQCKEKSCPYCYFHIQPQLTTRANLKLLFHQLNHQWKLFKFENNFAPTKKILMMLSQSKEFVSLLHSNPSVSSDMNLKDDLDWENSYRVNHLLFLDSTKEESVQPFQIDETVLRIHNVSYSLENTRLIPKEANCFQPMNSILMKKPPILIDEKNSLMNRHVILCLTVYLVFMKLFIKKQYI